jgi:branched-chain amino acid transport system ATP-binding protein
LPLLDVRSVDVRFGGVHALEDVDVNVEPGMVTGLIGPNGAGKTTLFNVISGLQPPTAGELRFEDRDITGVRAFRRSRLGIGRTFQRLEVFGSLSVRDNIRVAAEIRFSWNVDDEDPDKIADGILKRVRLTHVAEERADALPTGLMRIVELGRALAIRPRLLLLDEPSSGLSEEETDLLAELLEELSGEGLAILLVEHDVELVMRVCRRIYVLDFGRIIAVGTPEEIKANRAVQAAYLGTEGTTPDFEA